MAWLGKLLFLPAGLWAASLAWRAAIRFLRDAGWDSTALPFEIAAASGLLLALLLSRRDFYRTLEHELTHLIAAVFCLRSPDNLSVNRGGNGQVVYSGDHNLVIDLAPYVIPLTASCLALLFLVASQPFAWPIRLAIAAACGYHLGAVFCELAQGQPDLAVHGKVFSLALILAAGSWFLAALLGLAAGDAAGWRASFALAGEIGRRDLEFLRALQWSSVPEQAARLLSMVDLP